MLICEPNVHRRCILAPDLPQESIFAGIATIWHVLKPFTGFAKAQKTEIIMIMMMIMRVLAKKNGVSVYHVRWTLCGESLGITIYDPDDGSQKELGLGELVTPEF